jgi:hypothetical protein
MLEKLFKVLLYLGKSVNFVNSLMKVVRNLAEIGIQFRQKKSVHLKIVKNVVFKAFWMK